MAIASGTWTNGTNGSGTWGISDSGVLTFSGTGKMADPVTPSTSNCPWFSYKSKVTSAVIGSGITHLGDNTFEEFLSLSSITIADTVTSIGKSAFFNALERAFLNEKRLTSKTNPI